VEPLHLDWPDCLNARDLGGTPARDRARIRTGALVRTDSHERLTPEGVAMVHAYGVSRIIDLRRELECTTNPSPFAGSALYLNLPVQDPADPDNEQLALADIYQTMLDIRPTLFAEAVRAIADAPAGAVVVHCAGGKDRTGMVVALALSVVGVAPEAIAADYALTEDRLRAINAAFLAGITDPEFREIVERLQPTPPENMLKVLKHLDSRYGGVEPYLLRHGLTSAHLDTLRARLLETG
jgi:protein-tyrosine phosphatase